MVDLKATDDNVLRRMRVACWITKAANTRSYYIRHCFSTQRLLGECASILRYTYIASLVSCSFRYYLPFCLLVFFFTISAYIQCFPSSLLSSFLFHYFCAFIYFFLNTSYCVFICYSSSFILLSLFASLSFWFIPYCILCVSFLSYLILPLFTPATNIVCLAILKHVLCQTHSLSHVSRRLC
jgi:hypothetical protein